MNICGIVCEFNPFHRGHRHLIDEARRAFGADSAIVCVMSGDFVQRGEAAAYPKHDRARAAVAGGADLVLELPLPWCMAGAETFARGGVGLLGATGLVTHLCFGSECGDLSALQHTARLLARPELDALLHAHLEKGVSYAAARQSALEALGGKPDTLARPNDILAVEYLRALERQALPITPFAVQRVGAAHDTMVDSEYPSASLLRRALRAGEEIGAWMPPPAAAALAQGDGVVDAERVELALMSRLRFLPEAAFAAAPDVSEGLEHRVFPAARTAPTLESAVDAAATKRYPRARVRRILVGAALGLRAGDGALIPPYLRVLASDDRGLALLREMEGRASLPILSKPAHVRALDERAERVFTLGAGAADLCALGLDTAAQRGGDRDWRSAPCIL